jgi:uncharacterized LabA/DUF88 family protein
VTTSSKRVAIFIDGGNFYRRLRDAGLARGARFNRSALVDFLLRGRSLVAKSYYIGIVRNHDHSPKSQKMVEDQQKFLGKLEGEGFSIRRGRIVYDHKIREKGVDVQIAMDLLIGAVEDCYDTAVIVSSDTDLIPAIRYVLRTREREGGGVRWLLVPTIARHGKRKLAECSIASGRYSSIDRWRQ